MKNLKKIDPEIAGLIEKEKKRQQETLMMIPSENIASTAVEEAVGSCLANKYAEGYPFRRYYQGQEFVDQIESLVIERAKKAFGVPHVNVQPYSGSPANSEVYLALLKPGDTLMGLSLAHGGHLTHGSPVSFSGKHFRSMSYILGKDGKLDYDLIEKMAKKEKPKIIIAGITAYPLVVDWQKFSVIATKVNAYLMADIAHLAGLVVAGVYPSPVPYAHIVTTTTHKTLRGPRGAMIMVTKKGIEYDPDLDKKIDSAVFPGMQGGPHINTIAGIGVALKEAQSKRFKSYAAQIIKNAKALANELKRKEFNLISGGTESHLILVDIRNKNIGGKLAAEALEAAGIVLNYNTIPFDPNPPFYPSGIRMGTPGITSRGMKEIEMKRLADWINETLKSIIETKNRLKITIDLERKRSVREKIISSTKSLKKINQEVKNICRRFPIKKLY